MKSILSFALVSMLAAAGCNNGMDQQSATKVMSSALVGTGVAQQQLTPQPGQSNATLDATRPAAAAPTSRALRSTTTAPGPSTSTSRTRTGATSRRT